MAKTRRTRRGAGVGRTVVGDGPRVDDGDLAKLLEMLAAAGVWEDELLRTLDRPDGTEQMLQRLVEAGLLPSREESLAGLMAMWKPLLKPGCDPWSAELTGLEFLAMAREVAATDDDLPDLLDSLTSQAEEHGGPEALAMVRVLAVVGPVRVRRTAEKIADCLVTAGLRDCPWVDGLGAPEVGPCFGYTDSAGAQEGLAAAFAYGSRPHALVVLIDHEFGGGVKDCWPTDRPDLVRADYQRAAKRYGLTFRDYPPSEARAILDRALRKRPCPVAPDQVEDVRDYLELLRLRTALLPEAENAERGPSRTAPATGATAVHRVKVTLLGARPPVWRRLELPSTITLRRLHQAIQAVFGWESGHPWVFETPAGAYGVADRALGRRSARAKRLEEVAPRARDLIYYVYGWRHEILVEGVAVAEPGVAYPRCVAGRHAVSGGFDLDEANAALARLSGVLVRPPSP
ncbi:plasmid pRiA4b ORF-3 family protein [Planosporangium flavigriseum]|uniref:plasmid pRiA4b ORF-3 family protein n=1 Tax=Planosporangium flavigriseum TaxID=373681 RepID=UPI00143B15F4|nr:plasmid pRiA4b ORF-3 family protein [Planosporangium flavigriseum]NJC67998.1 plasmid pRiA4b ORF-3 family protein [Planosporangium flavigriseum]